MPRIWSYTVHDTCTGIEKCSKCTSEFHTANSCIGMPKCVSCGEGSSHPSSAPTCPTFIRKCTALDERYPENAMPYFPTNENWTWAASPSPPSIPSPSSPSFLPPPQQANPRQHHSPRPIRQNQCQHKNNSNFHPFTTPSHSYSHSYSYSQPRQSDNGWSGDLQQTTLANAWGPQPQVALAPSTRIDSSPPAPSQ